MPIAEMDVQLATPISDALHLAIARSDTGYNGDKGEVAQSLAAFARRRWGWVVDPELVVLVPDVAIGVTEVLRRTVRRDDAVVIMPPVYPPFREWLADIRAGTVEVPLRANPEGSRMDLDSLAAAMRAGASAVLLCHPQNPTGHVHQRNDLEQLATLADEHEVLVISDEIHGPLAPPAAGFVPFLDISDAARRCGIAMHSASKAFNVAGLKCAQVVAAHHRHSDLLRTLPSEMRWATGHLGTIAACAAFEQCDEWLDDLVRRLGRRRELLAALVADRLPEVRLHPGSASYLAWLDFGAALPRVSDAAVEIYRCARVQLSSGADFGTGHEQSARLNFATSEDLLTEAINRIAASLHV